MWWGRANDICRESKRQTINADDVLKALEDIEFPDFVMPLKASLDGMQISIYNDQFMFSYNCWDYAI